MAEGRRYEVIEAVGKGGFGTVYRAKLIGDGGFSKVVALKVLNPNMEGVDDVARRLRDEARLLGMLRHRVFVQVDGLVRLDGRWTVVMEFVEGVDLKTLVKASPMPVAPALELLAETAGALFAAFTTKGPDGNPLKLLHRDIKPSNIQLTTMGEPKVLDFGIARANFEDREAETRSQMYGSAGYMSPERLDFIDGPEGDVYALGCVLFEVVTGEQLGKASGNLERHDKMLKERLGYMVGKFPDSKVLVPILEGMLAYDAEKRPTAREVERKCIELRRQVEGPQLRDWAEVHVTPLVNQRPSFEKDGITGAVLSESMTIARPHEPEARSNRGVMLGGAVVVGLAAVVAALVVVLGGSGLALVAWKSSSTPASGSSLQADLGTQPPVPVPVPDSTPPTPASTPPAPASTAPASTAPVSTTPADSASSTAPVPTAASTAPAPTSTPKGPKKPDPVVVTPPPPPPPPPPPVTDAAPMGTVNLTGDATKVALGDGSSRYPLPGKVPPGTYTVFAGFDGAEPTAAGKVQVVADATVNIACDSFFGGCKVK